MPGAPDSAAVQQMVALFAQSLGRASMDTLQVGRGVGAAGGQGGVMSKSALQLCYFCPRQGSTWPLLVVLQLQAD